MTLEELKCCHLEKDGAECPFIPVVVLTDKDNPRDSDTHACLYHLDAMKYGNDDVSSILNCVVGTGSLIGRRFTK